MNVKSTLSFIGALALSVCAFQVSAQTTHAVENNGFTWSPSDITIDQGDTVEWTNTGGSHNVNGTQATFPDNPESFGNSVGSGWVYSFTFNIPGVYNYQCDPHASLGMTGTVTVVATTSVDEIQPEATVAVYPQPASEYIVFDFQAINSTGNQLVVFDLKGREVVSFQDVTVGETRVAVSDWEAGNFVYQLKNGDNIVLSGVVLVK